MAMSKSPESGRLLRSRSKAARIGTLLTPSVGATIKAKLRGKGRKTFPRAHIGDTSAKVPGKTANQSKVLIDASLSKLPAKSKKPVHLAESLTPQQGPKVIPVNDKHPKSPGSIKLANRTQVKGCRYNLRPGRYLSVEQVILVCSELAVERPKESPALQAATSNDAPLPDGQDGEDGTINRHWEGTTIYFGDRNPVAACIENMLKTHSLCESVKGFLVVRAIPECMIDDYAGATGHTCDNPWVQWTHEFNPFHNAGISLGRVPPDLLYRSRPISADGLTENSGHHHQTRPVSHSPVYQEAPAALRKNLGSYERFDSDEFLPQIEVPSCNIDTCYEQILNLYDELGPDGRLPPGLENPSERARKWAKWEIQPSKIHPDRLVLYICDHKTNGAWQFTEAGFLHYQILPQASHTTESITTLFANGAQGLQVNGRKACGSKSVFNECIPFKKKKIQMRI